MDWTGALLTLLHLLVPIYWLGGDLGAFYSGQVLADPRRSADERLFGLKILLAIDMAPRTALILAFPTGFALAWAKGWLAVPGWSVAAAWVVGLPWLAAAWGVHLIHGPGGAHYKTVDNAIRHTALGLLVVNGIAGLAGWLEMPLFVSLKLLLLALAVALGLLIRRLLKPLFPAIAALRSEGASAATDMAIAGVIGRTRLAVLAIWGAVLAAALLGIATPN
jgi:hypothetical protein